MTADDLNAAIAEVSQWSEELLARLVACPSVTGEPSAIADLLAPLLVDLGFDIEAVPVDPMAQTRDPEYSPPQTVRGTPPPVLHARWPGAGDRADLLLFAHTDTEPVHDGWTTDPFQLRVRDGRAYGLGVADDKAGVVSVLAAVRAVRNAGLDPVWRPRIILGAGKQGGALGTLPGTRAAQGVGAAVYCHPAESGRGLVHLKVASRGVAQIEVTVTGVTPAPQEERTPVSADPRHGRNAAARAARLATALAEGGGAGVVRAVTGLAAGAEAFQVPDTARFVMACWFDDADLDAVVAECERLLRASAADDWERDHPPVLRVIGTRANPASCANSPFAQWSARLIGGVTGVPVEDYAWHSASDIRFPIRCLGVPAVGFGGLAGGFYGADEWVDLTSMHQCTDIMARMLTTEAAP